MTSWDEEDVASGPYAEECRKCGADIGRPCAPHCIYADDDPPMSDDEYAGMAGYPDTLIDTILEGGVL